MYPPRAVADDPQPDARPRTQPTVIRYRAYRLSWNACVAAALSLAIALFVFSRVNVTHLVCARTGEGRGECVVTSYAIFVDERRRVVPLEEIVEMDLTNVRQLKGTTYANVELRTSSGTIDVSGGHILHERALDAKARFTQFHSTPTSPKLDLWVHDGPLSHAIMGVIGLVMLVLGTALATEQLRQLRWIRIVVDHARGVLEIGGRKVAIDDVRDVKLEAGEALPLSSGRGAHVVGHRLVVETRHGPIPATKDHRVGDIEEHRRARDALLAALGGRVEEAARQRAIAKEMKKKRRRKK